MKLSDFRSKLIILLGTLLQKKYVICEISATEVLNYIACSLLQGHIWQELTSWLSFVKVN